MGYQIMTPEEVKRAMRKAEALHAGKTNMPQEVIYLEKQIKEKIVNLALLTRRFRGIVDQSAVNEILELVQRKDAAWARFGLE